MEKLSEIETKIAVLEIHLTNKERARDRAAEQLYALRARRVQLLKAEGGECQSN